MTAVAVLAGNGEAAADPRVDREAPKVLAVTKGYQAAFLARQPRRICSYLTGQAKRRLVAELADLQTRPTCAATIRSALLLIGPEDMAPLRKTRAALETDDVSIHGGRATVSLRGARRLKLLRVNSRWWVSDTRTRS
jgi:hypothetical protein